MTKNCRVHHAEITVPARWQKHKQSSPCSQPCSNDVAFCLELVKNLKASTGNDASGCTPLLLVKTEGHMLAPNEK